MKILSFKSFFVFFVVVLFSAITSFAQQNISPEKKALIQELRQLTESGTLSISAALTTINTKEIYSAQIEKDSELSDSQKQELKKFISASEERINNQIKNYFTDKSIMKELTDKVGFELYDKNFAEDELKELITFYKTPTGQKAAKFMPAVRTQLGKAFKEAFDQKIQEFLKPIIQVEDEQLKKKIQEAKTKKNEN